MLLGMDDIVCDAIVGDLCVFGVACELGGDEAKRNGIDLHTRASCRSA